MKTVAYLRVSTTRQDVQGQRLAILEYARRHHLQIDEFVEATASAVTSPKRRRLDDLMSALDLPPGPRIGSLLARLREAEAVGEITSRDDAFALAAQLLDDQERQ